MNDRVPNEHLSADRLQAFLEGDLPKRESALAEEHLAGCARCSSELDAWRILIEDLDTLPGHVPDEGFAERVMSGVSLPESTPLAARVRERVIITGSDEAHVDGASLQDFLDGSLGRRAAGTVEAHLAACGSCAGEAEQWGMLMTRLGELQSFRPTEGFSNRVMAEVRLAEPVPFAARLRERISALMPAGAAEHLGMEQLQDFVDGALSGHRLARVQTHLNDCAACSTESAAWQDLVMQLHALERFEPEPGFASRVMRRVRMPAAIVAANPVSAWANGRAAARAALPRALAFAGRFVPRTKRAWAAISGVAVTPATIVGLVLYAVFSHPTLTLGSLASFVWWQVADLASAGWATVSVAALQGAEVFGVNSLFEALASAPMVVAGGAFAYALMSGLALRVLYRNIITNRPMDGRYVRYSAS